MTSPSTCYARCHSCGSERIQWLNYLAVVKDKDFQVKEENGMRILLIDDHGILRAGVRNLILQAHRQAETIEAATANEGLQLAMAEALDLIFLDLRLPQEPGGVSSGEVGLNTLKQLHEMEKSAPVIVMSGEILSKSAIERIMKAGAASFVPKVSSPEVMLEAIQRAIRGGVWLPPETTGVGGDVPPPSIDSLLRDPPPAVTAADLGITKREFDVLRLAMQGNAPWKVAKILEINPTNTRRYLSRLYNRFGVIDLYGLQCHFAKTGQLLGIISSSSMDRAARPAVIAS
ncbi:MAG: response regulator [Burkholderiales bacterium]